MPETLDIAIVGAGAAGLMAAAFAGRQQHQSKSSLRIAAFDGARKVGAKILVSGGGRCNITHDVVLPEDFAGGNRNQIAKVLRTFTVDEVVAFFDRYGVTLKREETGKLFPTTDRAQTVLDALLSAVADAGAEIRTETRVEAIGKVNDLFALHTAKGDVTARSVILATGGKSLPNTGSDGHGYQLARSLGHRITRTTPALVPLVLPERHWLTGLSGISVTVELILQSATGKILHRQQGDMLLTHFGLSGPAIMDISRHWIAAHESDPQSRLSANLLPGQSFEEVEQKFVAAAAARAKTNTAAFLRQWFPERLADALCVAVGTKSSTELGQLPREQRRALIHQLTALPLPVVRDRGYLFAEVTAGGVPLAEVNVNTMASRVCPSLFLCGEILDVDGRIGGYNFQWAWNTGRLAGIHAALSLNHE